MTQFCFFTGYEPDVSGLKGAWTVAYADMHPLIQETAQKFLTEEQLPKTWVLQGGEHGEPVDYLFGHIGYEMVVEQNAFSETQFGRYLQAYIDGEEFERLTFFYGAGDQPLVVYKTPVDLFEHISDPDVFEVNAIYSK